MGAWGYGIFEDDVACDVRDSFMALLSEQLDAAAATAALLSKWQETLNDPDEGPAVWLALALTQHKLGHLDERVRREALRIIDGDLGLDLWCEQGQPALKRRRAALAKARATLEAPQPPPRKIKPPFRDECKWGIGELIAYRLKSGAWSAFRVVAHETHAHGVAPVIEFLEWRASSPPSPAALAKSGVLRRKFAVWPLFQLMARNSTAHADEPQLAVKRLLADLGLLDAAAAGVSFAGALDAGSGAPPPGFDWAVHMRQVEKAVDRVRAADPDVTKRLHGLARRRNPKLLESISQFSVRREPGLETLPTRRLKRLKASLPATAPGDWLVTRWSELDEVLDDVLGLK